MDAQTVQSIAALIQAFASVVERSYMTRTSVKRVESETAEII